MSRLEKPEGGRRGKDIFAGQDAILASPALSHGAARLMMVIYGKAGNGDGVCWATNRTLGKAIGATGTKPGSIEKAASRFVAELIELGWIVVTDPEAGKFNKRRRFVLGPKFGVSDVKAKRFKADDRRRKASKAERSIPDDIVPGSPTISSPTPDNIVHITTPGTTPGTAPGIKPPPLSTSPAQPARARADSGGGEDEIRSRFIRTCIGKWGDRRGQIGEVARKAAESHPLDRLDQLTTAVEAIQMGEARRWADVLDILGKRPALVGAGTARRPPPDLDDITF